MADSAPETPLTVSQVSARIKDRLESDVALKDVSVTGEISNFKRHSSGHIYFSLKDQETQIRCVFFRARNLSLKFEPRDGMQAVARGSIQVYPKSGTYQLYVARMEQGGIGLLFQKREELRKKLVAEGLTAADRKRALPPFPRRIGIVSSIDSAGLRDALKVLARRWPLARIVVAPVNVEGESSAPSIAAGLKLMADHGRPDVVIVGRGGGSIESLWGFNTEIVARAIAAMPVPVVAAIGHETDVTIADMVADRRAATPTEAAELVAPSADAVKQSLAELRGRAADALFGRVRELSERLVLIGRTLRSPETAIELRQERVDRARERMEALMRERVARRQRVVHGVGTRLAALSPQMRLMRGAARLEKAGLRLKQALPPRLRSLARELELRRGRLNALSPTAILARGYAVPLFQGRTLKDSAAIAVGEVFSLRLHRGELGCEVKDRKET